MDVDVEAMVVLVVLVLLVVLVVLPVVVAAVVEPTQMVQTSCEHSGFSLTLLPLSFLQLKLIVAIRPPLIKVRRLKHPHLRMENVTVENQHMQPQWRGVAVAVALSGDEAADAVLGISPPMLGKH